MRPFHLAFPVSDLDATRRFYRDVMGCRIGREKEGAWIDFDLFGHQLSAHLRPDARPAAACGGVDGDQVPIPHFGVVLTMDDWRALAARLEADPATDWRLKPKIRFEGEPGEQATMFVMDPSGNALEFKAFADDAAIFAA
ncbi:MAG: VOC family protein [Hansschlegelia sp.]